MYYYKTLKYHIVDYKTKKHHYAVEFKIEYNLCCTYSNVYTVAIYANLVMLHATAQDRCVPNVFLNTLYYCFYSHLLIILLSR